MLDNLIGADLSGVSGYIRYDNAVEMMPGVIMGIVSLFLVLGLLCILSKFLSGTASKRYRELLSDMYVVGKVKQIAVEDKIDLVDELKTFKKIMKKSGNDLRSIDDVVSMELKERIQEDGIDSKPSKK